MATITTHSAAAYKSELPMKPLQMGIVGSNICTLIAQQMPGLVVHTLNSTESDSRQASGRVADLHLWLRMERLGYREFSFLTQTSTLSESALVVDIEVGWPWASLRYFDRAELTNVDFMQQFLSFSNKPRVASADADGFLLLAILAV